MYKTQDSRYYPIPSPCVPPSSKIKEYINYLTFILTHLTPSYSDFSMTLHYTMFMLITLYYVCVHILLCNYACVLRVVMVHVVLRMHLCHALCVPCCRDYVLALVRCSIVAVHTGRGVVLIL